MILKLKEIRIWATLAFSVVLAAPALATVPDVLPVQGFLTDDVGDAVDGEYSIQFSIYNSPTADVPLWTDLFTTVPVEAGFFTVYLGANIALNFETLLAESELWLGITVADDDEMERIPISSVPFATEAMVCQQVGTLTEDDISTGFLPATYTPSWAELTGIPADIADGDDVGYSTESELTAVLNDNYLSSTYAPVWADLSGVPADIADGDDVGYTTEAQLTALLDDNYAPSTHNHNGDYISTGTGVITSDMIVDGAVTAADLSTNSVDAAEIATDAVGAPEIAANAVGTSEVSNNSLTRDDLAPNSVGASELGSQIGSDVILGQPLLDVDNFAMSGQTVTMPVAGTCIVNVTGYATGLDDDSTANGFFFRTAIQEGGDPPSEDTENGMYAMYVGYSNSTGVSATWAHSIAANTATQFGCAARYPPTNWQEGRFNCRVSWICMPN